MSFFILLGLLLYIFVFIYFYVVSLLSGLVSNYLKCLIDLLFVVDGVEDVIVIFDSILINKLSFYWVWVMVNSEGFIVVGG